jgi:uncharacterized protein
MYTKGIAKSDKIKVAVVFQGHPFDVPGFRDMFERMPDVDYYLQDFENWAIDDGKVWHEYDVHLFYNMHYWGRFSVRGGMADYTVKRAIEHLGETEQGILVLHHALLAFPDTENWTALCNCQNRRLRGCTGGETVETRIASPSHPITKGLQPWTMTDEVYIIDEPGQVAGAGGFASDVLLTTDNPNSMKALGWAHQYRRSRVFCYESGHDNEVYTNPNFQAVLHRAIQWLAHRL